MLIRKGQVNRPRRKAVRRQTLPFQIVLRISSPPLSLNCSLRDMTESGARIEFENWDDARRITRSIVASFVWVHIPTENIWRETIVRWFDGKFLGIEFVGAGRLQPPKRVLKND